MADNAFQPVSESSFDEAVLARPGLTLVDFWSNNCVPCKQLSKVLDQLADEIPSDVMIATVAAEENTGLLQRFGVRGFPTLMFFKDGEVVETRTGVDRRQVLKKAVEAHLGAPAA